MHHYFVSFNYYDLGICCYQNASLKKEHKIRSGQVKDLCAAIEKDINFSPVNILSINYLGEFEDE